MIRIVNEDGSIIERELNQEELKQLAEDKAIFEKESAAMKAKQNLRKSALSKLIDLGLTEEEIAAL